MNKHIQHISKILLTAFCSMLICVLIPSSAFAAQIKITLKEMGASDNIDLKTVKTFREFHFTKPKNWKVLPKSKMVLTFQHSPQLLPERSSLNILINDQVVKTIQLSKDNSTKTTTSFLIPPDVLKDHNMLTFDVDQHYTYKCEDPFDPSLWTTVINSSEVTVD
ncbi:MAG: cellulose biosynthesis cyclic di-GMP-binding regulatory protein BcsB, partial [Vampirovibrionia bacterium]